MERNDLHPVAMKVWTRVSSHGKTHVYFIKRGTTISIKYCIEHFLEPLIKYDIPHLINDAKVFGKMFDVFLT